MRRRGCALRETGSAWSSSEPGESPGVTRRQGEYRETGRWDIPSPGVRVPCALFCGREKQLVLNKWSTGRGRKLEIIRLKCGLV